MKINRGFTLVEILIVVVILGILAAIVIPQFTNATSATKTSSLCTNLQRIRSQIEVYRTYHDDNPPSLSNFETQMTGKTDITGDTSGAELGPYLRAIPVEPFTNSRAVSASGTVGWNYDEETLRFWAPYDPNL